MKVAAIDIDKDAIRVVELQKGMRGASVSNHFKMPLVNGNLSEALKDVVKKIPEAEIVVSFDSRDVSFRTLNLPITDIKKIEKTIPFEAEDLLPFPIDELIIDYQIIEKGEKETTVCIVAAKKEKIKTRLEALSSGGIDPKVINIAPSALSAIANHYLKDEKGVYAVVYSSVSDVDIGIFENGGLRFFRNIPLIGEWEMDVCNTLYIFQATGRKDIERIYLCGSSGKDDVLKKEIAALHSIEPVQIDFTKDTEIKIESEYAKALGLALREAEGKGFGINLRKGDLAYKREGAETKKRLRYTIIFGGIAALLFILNLSVKYYMVESKYQAVTNEIRRNFNEALPDVKKIINEEQQLKSAAAEAKKKIRLLGGRIKGDVTALDLFKEVTERMPAGQKVILFEFSLEGDKIRLSGETTSFEAADKIKEGLSKSNFFKEVTLSDAKIGAEQNKIKFRINITLHEAI